MTLDLLICFETLGLVNIFWLVLILFSVVVVSSHLVRFRLQVLSLLQWSVVPISVLLLLWVCPIYVPLMGYSRTWGAVLTMALFPKPLLCCLGLFCACAHDRWALVLGPVRTQIWGISVSSLSFVGLPLDSLTHWLSFSCSRDKVAREKRVKKDWGFLLSSFDYWRHLSVYVWPEKQNFFSSFSYRHCCCFIS